MSKGHMSSMQYQSWSGKSTKQTGLTRYAMQMQLSGHTRTLEVHCIGCNSGIGTIYNP